MNEYKHYIRLNPEKYIIKSFSDAFEPSLSTDILIHESCSRHFYMDNFGFNPDLYNYQWIDGKIIYNPKSVATLINTELTDSQIADIVRFAIKNNSDFMKLVLPIATT